MTRPLVGSAGLPGLLGRGRWFDLSVLGSFRVGRRRSCRATWPFCFTASPWAVSAADDRDPVVDQLGPPANADQRWWRPGRHRLSPFFMIGAGLILTVFGAAFIPALYDVLAVGAGGLSDYARVGNRCPGSQPGDAGSAAEVTTGRSFLVWPLRLSELTLAACDSRSSAACGLRLTFGRLRLTLWQIPSAEVCRCAKPQAEIQE